MAHDITEPTTALTQYFSPVVTVPDDGDAAAAASVADDPDVGMAALTYRTRFLLTAAHGYLQGASRLESTDGTTITVSPIARLVLGGKLYEQAAITLTDAYVVGGLFTHGANYVYCFDNGVGALGFLISSDPPDSALRWRDDGLETHRYLGSFLRTAAGSGASFDRFLSLRSDGRIEYHASRNALYGIMSNTGTNANQSFSVGAAGVNLPASVKIVRVLIESRGGAGAGLLHIYFRGNAEPAAPQPVLAFQGAQPVHATLPHATTVADAIVDPASPEIVITAPSSEQYTLRLYGYVESA